MSEERYEKMFEALLKEGQEDAVPRAIAQHLAKVALGAPVPTLDLYPEVYDKAKQLINFAKERGTPIRLTSGFRGFDEQDDLYQKGRIEAGNIVTNAKAGQSYHNYGLAFDIAFSTGNPYPNDRTKWEPLGAFGESIGLVWGAGFGDYGHFEYHPGFDWRDVIKYFS